MEGQMKVGRYGKARLSEFKETLLSEWCDLTDGYLDKLEEDIKGVGLKMSLDPWGAFATLLDRMTTDALLQGEPRRWSGLSGLTCALASTALHEWWRFLRSKAQETLAQESRFEGTEAVAVNESDIISVRLRGMARMAMVYSDAIWQIERALVGISAEDLEPAWAALAEAAEGVVRRVREGQDEDENTQAFLRDLQQAAAEWEKVWEKVGPEWVEAFRQGARDLADRVGEVWAFLTVRELTECLPCDK